MTRVGNVDQILLLLQEQLRRRGDSPQAAKSDRANRPDAVSRGPLERARTLTALKALSDEERRRALVHGLLAEEFGEAVANDASFQQIVDKVARIIGELPEGERLVERAIGQLRQD